MEVLATSLRRRFWICDNQHAFLNNEDGEGPPVVLHMGTTIINILKATMSTCWSRDANGWPRIALRLFAGVFLP